MKVIAQSTATTKVPYFHLAYLAANNVARQIRGNVVLAGGLIFIFGAMIFAKTLLPSLTRRIRLVIAIPIMVASFAIFLCGFVFMTPAYSPSYSIIRVGNAFQRYAENNEGVLPDAQNWCDSLIIDGQLDPHELIFDGGDVLFGECAFAYNQNVAGKKLSEIPPDTVLLFETDLGHDASNRNANLSQRGFLIQSKDKSYSTGYYANLKVSEKRWNQSGGIEILTNRYNDGKGCDVLFVGGHAEFVPAKKIQNLKW